MHVERGYNNIGFELIFVVSHLIEILPVSGTSSKIPAPIN
jgi:hypothetical protein